MKVTVVTPTYNAEQYIPTLLSNIACIKSIDIEHIVVDGGSSDKTLDVVRKFSSCYNLKWISGKDKGQYDAINKGFAMASNDLIGYQNCDDFYIENGLVSLLRALEDNPDAVGAYGKYVVIDVNEKFLAFPHNIGPYDSEKLRKGNYIFPGAFVARKSQLGDIRFDHNLNFYGDWDWLLQMLATGKSTLYIPSMISTFRLHKASKTSIWSYKDLHAEREYISNKHKLDINKIEVQILATRITQRISTEFKRFTGAYKKEFQSCERILKERNKVNQS